MSVEVKFCDGPADGKTFVVEGDPMDPPMTTEVLQPSPLKWSAAEADEPTPIRKALYRREVNDSDDGPLWLYRYDRQASEEPALPGEGS